MKELGSPLYNKVRCLISLFRTGCVSKAGVQVARRGTVIETDDARWSAAHGDMGDMGKYTHMWRYMCMHLCILPPAPPLL